MNKREKEFAELLSKFKELESLYLAILEKDKNDDFADNELCEVRKCIAEIEDVDNLSRNREDEYRYFHHSNQYKYRRLFEKYQRKYNYVCPYTKEEFEKIYLSNIEELENCKIELAKFIKDHPRNRNNLICKSLIESINEYIQMVRNREKTIDSDRYEVAINDITAVVNRYKNKIKLIKKDQYIAY